ncbi:MAG: hypothetical protein WAL56_24625 [Candidatus Sulfotelmatobacter sp.]
MKSQTDEAIVRRINHKLETDSTSGSVMKVRKARGQKSIQELGEHYMVDVDIRALAKKLGV